MSILIRNVSVNGKITDIAVKENRIAGIAPEIQGTFDTVIDGTDCAAFPPFYNTHCHAAMTLLRGIADDMELFDWLNHHIWPAEAKMTPEHIYWGTKLACMEMIRTGTVFFNDMYFCPDDTIRAVEETGLRAAIGLICMDVDPSAAARYEKINRSLLERKDQLSSRLQLAFAPHAIYTVRESKLRQIAEQAENWNLKIHIHLAETEAEVQDCLKLHGCTPVKYLDTLGLLSDRTLAAHSIHCMDSDLEIIRDRKTTVSYMPCSNYKLSSGRFRFHRMMEEGIRVTIGTDGCASNNNLSMFDEMKSGALGAKLEFGGPTGCNVNQIFTAATRNGAEAFGIDAGVIQEGKLADLMLIDLNSTMMVADHNCISNLVYSADSSCVSTVICDGKILMRDRVIPGYEETIRNARRCARELVR